MTTILIAVCLFVPLGLGLSLVGLHSALDSAFKSPV